MTNSVESDRRDAPSQSEPRVDLHVHSTASDGRLAPPEVMTAAKERGLQVVALTDHDTVAGLAEAARTAGELDLEFVPGIELSTYDESGSTHLLGYFVDENAPEFINYRATVHGARARRAAEIVEKLNRVGIGIAMEEVESQAGPNGLIARPHIARALSEGGWVKSYREAFDRFIAAGQPAYVPTRHATPQDGIRRIHAAGGVAVLAHPGNSHDAERIRGLKDEGLDGLEVLHPDHQPRDVDQLRQLAEELDLLETGGSDWHGPLGGWRGNLGSQPVPYDWYTRLRDSAERARSST